MDILIFGVMVAVAIFTVIYVQVKIFTNRYTQSLSESKGNSLIANFIKVYDDENMSLTDKDEKLTAILNEFRKHSESNMFVTCQPDELPENVTHIEHGLKRVS